MLESSQFPIVWTETIGCNMKETADPRIEGGSANQNKLVKMTSGGNGVELAVSLSMYPRLAVLYDATRTDH